METTFEVHLRRIIEQQPVCLIRVDRSGTFLAVNEAAMSLFGASRLDELIDTTILSLVLAEEREDCREFIERVAAGGRGSIEFDVDALTGARHAVQMSAAALPGSPDGIPSAYCTVRDISKRRTLERALVASAAREETQTAALHVAQQQFDQAVAEQSERVASLERGARQAEARAQDLEEQLARDRRSLEAACESVRQDCDSRQFALEQALAEAGAREQSAASKLAEQKALVREALDAAEMALRRIRRGALASGGTHAAPVIRPLTSQLEALLSPGISFRAHIQPSETRVELSAEQLEMLVTLLTASQRGLMIAGGAVALELADVHIDDACALERGTSAGQYLLIALHATGPRVDAGLPDALFSAQGDEAAWRSLGTGAVAALQLARSAGGHGSVTKQGLDAIALELYLPAVEHVATEMTK